ncbi:MAG: hypothetical protein Q9227_002543 [Pyrenula ochraceoflavens]
MPSVLIVGATRGLGASLTSHYSQKPLTRVYGTSRSSTAPTEPTGVKWLTSIDLSTPNCGTDLASALSKENTKIDTLIITAGYFGTESFDTGPDWDKELKMYTTSSMGPVFIVHSLIKSGILEKGSKIILVSSESGSIALRHPSEGGGNYAHHASKAALNMVGKLLSLDLHDKGIAVGIIHPGFMRTEMTKGVGFDKFWDAGGAVTPDEAAKSLAEWTEGFGMERSGTYWAVRGPGDIGTVEDVTGKKKGDLPTPMELPW